MSTFRNGRTNITETTVDDLKADLGSLRDDLSVLREDAKNFAAGIASVGAERARDGVQSVQDTMRGVAEQAGTVHDGVCDRVRKHPTSAVVIAAGLGLVAGKFLLPRRS